jgi:hypothetical protein
MFTSSPSRDRRGVDLISDALPYGGLWYAEANANQQRKVSQPVHIAL